MSYEISVPTPFNDISELAESFHSRVDEERLMLPSGESIPEGEWVQFAVILADGSAALQGQGRCTGSFDNGEDRAPEHRFDVVMDSLQFEEMAQIYFDRILQVRAGYAGDEPQTGETEVPEDAGYAEAQPVAVADPQAEAPAEAYAEAPAEEAYAEAPAEEAYAEAPAEEAYAEAPAEEAYAEAPAEEAHAEAPAEEAYAEAPGDFDGAEDGTLVQASADELTASQAEAYAEPAPEAAYDEAQAGVSGAEAYDSGYAGEESAFDGEDTRAVSYEEVAAEAQAVDVEDVAFNADDLPSEELDSGLIEEAELDPGTPPAAAPSLAVPTESRIYELPAPQAPGALPSPHSNDAVLTRRLLHATWSPQPAARAERGASTGLFEYAPGAGLPQPASPPRPDIDPSHRVAPAPQPGDAYVAPTVASHDEAPAEAAYEGGYEEAPVEAAYEGEVELEEGAYAEAAPAEGYEEAGNEEPVEGAYEEAGVDVDASGYVEEAPEGGYEVEAGEVGEVEVGEVGEVEAGEVYEEAYPAGEQAGEGEIAAGYGDDVGYDDMQTMDAATRQVDVSGLPDDIPIGEETLQVEIPEEEPGVNLRGLRPSIGHATMKDRLHRALTFLLASAIALLIASVAAAQARVRVQVRGGDAAVTLTAESGGATYRCRTQNGACSIDGVATGQYVVSAEPAGDGQAPLPRRVMVGGAGEVTVHLRLR